MRAAGRNKRASSRFVWGERSESVGWEKVWGSWYEWCRIKVGSMVCKMMQASEQALQECSVGEGREAGSGDAKGCGGRGGKVWGEQVTCVVECKESVWGAVRIARPVVGVE